MRSVLIAIALTGTVFASAAQAAPAGPVSRGLTAQSDELMSQVRMRRGYMNRGRHLGWRIGRGNPHRRR